MSNKAPTVPLFDSYGDQLLIFADGADDGGPPLLASSMEFSNNPAHVIQSVIDSAIYLEAMVGTEEDDSSVTRFASAIPVSLLRDAGIDVQALAPLKPWERTMVLARLQEHTVWSAMARILCAKGCAEPFSVRA